MNVGALKMAREVADGHGCLMAGNICNSTVYRADVPETHKETENIFKVQCSRRLIRPDVFFLLSIAFNSCPCSILHLR